MAMPIPTDIYHYTSAAGLAGILSGSSIYGTHMAYLNDAEEMVYGLEISREIFAPGSGIMTAAAVNDPKYVRSIRDVLSRLQSEVAANLTDRRRYPFVSCFSAKGDQLSQWRGYADDGGYAIRFDGKLLRRSIWRELENGESKPDPFTDVREIYDLKQVVYGKTGGSRYVKDVVDALIPAILNQCDEPEDSSRDRLGFEYEYDLIRLEETMALIKNPAFKEEREFRLTAYIPAALHDKPCFFSAPSRIGLIPRVKLKFDPRCVTGVVIGPGEFKKVRGESVEDFIDAHRRDYPFAEVLYSNVPYRAI